MIEDARKRQRRHRRIRIALLAAAAATAGALILGIGGPSGSGGTARTAPHRHLSAGGVLVPGSIAAASNLCGHSFIGTGAAATASAFAQQPVLTETHGSYKALIEVSRTGPYACLLHGTRGPRSHINPDFQIHITRYTSVRAAPGRDEISTPYGLRSGVGTGGIATARRLMQIHGATPEERRVLRARFAGAGYGPTALGQTGSDVSAVSFTFANGDTVAAIVRDGWYFAWWPWTSTPTAVNVTTSSGTTSSPVTGNEFPDPVIPQCRPGTAGCVFANTTG